MERFLFKKKIIVLLILKMNSSKLYKKPLLKNLQPFITSVFKLELNKLKKQ